MENDTQRSYCFGDNRAKLEIFERPWHDSIVFIRNCVCNYTSNSSVNFPFVYFSTGREVEVHFSAINMTKYDDPDTLNFIATFEFVKVPIKCKDVRRKLGSEGTISLNDAEVSFA